MYLMPKNYILTMSFKILLFPQNTDDVQKGPCNRKHIIFYFVSASATVIDLFIHYWLIDRSSQLFVHSLYTNCNLIFLMFYSEMCHRKSQQHLTRGNCLPGYSQHARRFQPLGREQETERSPSNREEVSGKEDPNRWPQTTRFCCPRYSSTYSLNILIYFFILF